MHRRHIIADQPISFFPTVPQCHPSIMQQTVQGATNLSGVWHTLNGDLCWGECGLFLGPWLVVAETRPVVREMILNKRQAGYFGIIERFCLHCPG